MLDYTSDLVCEAKCWSLLLSVTENHVIFVWVYESCGFFGQRNDEVILSLSLLFFLEGLDMAEYGMLWMSILPKHRIILSQYDWIVQSHPKRIVLWLVYCHFQKMIWIPEDSSCVFFHTVSNVFHVNYLLWRFVSVLRFVFSLNLFWKVSNCHHVEAAMVAPFCSWNEPKIQM